MHRRIERGCRGERGGSGDMTLRTFFFKGGVFLFSLANINPFPLREHAIYVDHLHLWTIFHTGVTAKIKKKKPPEPTYFAQGFAPLCSNYTRFVD